MIRRDVIVGSVFLVTFAAAAQEPPRLRGGFGRPAATATPAPPNRLPPAATPVPSATPAPAARTMPSPVPADGPAPRAAAPSAAAAPSEPRRATASVSVGYVLVPFVVTDLRGRARSNVKRGDVSLFVDGRPAAFDIFERSEDAAISFTILLDGSGSMGLAGKMEGARAAIASLLDARRARDEFALYVFAEGKVREAVPFTRDTAPIRRAVREIVPYGKTALYDAIARMPDQSLLGSNPVRAILLLTDGIDNASSLTLDQLEELFTGVEVPVYPLGIRGAGVAPRAETGLSRESLLNMQVLGDLSRMSGGLLEVVDDPAKLPAAIGEIERDLRSQYVIGFTPTGRGVVKFRRISLKIAGPAYRLRVRVGYRGTEPPERVSR